MIIALTGHKQAGKDTFASFLKDFGYERRALADPLKEIAAVIGWDGTKDERDPCVVCGMLQGRTLLQKLGTEGVREVLGNQVWVEALIDSLDDDGRYVITDVRFPNEVEDLKDLLQPWHEVVAVKIERPGFEGDGHASELGVDEIAADFHIDNSGDLDFLEQSAETLVAFLEGRSFSKADCHLDADLCAGCECNQ